MEAGSTNWYSEEPAFQDSMRHDWQNESSPRRALDSLWAFSYITLVTIYYLLHVDDYQYDVTTKHTERKYKYGQSGYKNIL